MNSDEIRNVRMIIAAIWSDSLAISVTVNDNVTNTLVDALNTICPRFCTMGSDIKGIANTYGGMKPAVLKSGMEIATVIYLGCEGGIFFNRAMNNSVKVSVAAQYGPSIRNPNF